MSYYLGDIAPGATITLTFNTNAAAGESATYSGGTVEVYKNEDLTQSTAGVTVSKDHDGKTGAHLVSVTTGDAFYVAGNYHVMLIGATVDGKAVNAFIGSFSIANRPMQGIADGILTAAKFASNFFTSIWATATRTLTSFGTLEDQLDNIEDLLTAPFEVTYTNPVNPSTQALEMWIDDDYTILSGRELANWASDSWLDYDLEHAEWIKFYYVDKFNTETEIGTVTVENDNKTLHAEFTKAEKLAAKLVVDYEYTYKVRTMLDDDHGNDEITLVTGNLGIRD